MTYGIITKEDDVLCMPDDVCGNARLPRYVLQKSDIANERNAASLKSKAAGCWWWRRRPRSKVYA